MKVGVGFKLKLGAESPIIISQPQQLHHIIEIELINKVMEGLKLKLSCKVTMKSSCQSYLQWLLPRVRQANPPHCITCLSFPSQNTFKFSAAYSISP